MDIEKARQFRFGAFEVDAVTGELRRQGMRVRMHAQPFAVLVMLVERAGEVVTREEISRELWPDGTFVDYEHGVNSAVNRVREALGDKASSPRFVETLARRGYRFVAPVERVGETAVNGPVSAGSTAEESLAAMTDGADRRRLPGGLLATADDLPRSSHAVVRTLFVLLELMYLGFYVGALANLPEIAELLSPLSYARVALRVVVGTAAVLIPVRVFLVCVVLFRPPRAREKLLHLWPFLVAVDALWALSPTLLLHHISVELAIAAMPLLVYSPFAQRSLVLMGAGDRADAGEARTTRKN